MNVLILKNTVSEGPGTIEDFLRERNAFPTVVELGEGEPVPSLDGFEALVVMGGPMAVYEADRHAFLKDGFRAVEGALRMGILVLGVCLGAQALAHVLGAKVYKGSTEEVGWLDVDLTSEGIKDPVVGSLARGGDGTVKVFHWHGDTFELPWGARRLARSTLYDNQAFGYGGTAYGLQFHIEVTREMISKWFRGELMEERVLEDTRKYHVECRRRATEFYKSFFGNGAVKGGGMV